MTISLPQAKQSTLARRDEFIAAFHNILPSSENIVTDEMGRAAYDTDAFNIYRTLPMIVVLPETTEQVIAILQYCHQEKIEVVPRGAGTSLSGGAQPLEDGVLLVMSKFTKVLDIDIANRTVCVQPGVSNVNITKAVEDQGFYYAPDPSSQIICSIGGNVAENSGGVHSLKYGLTTNNIYSVKIVLIDGTLLEIGGNHIEQNGIDLLSVIIGSEGLLGVVTEVRVKILPTPEVQKAMLVGFHNNDDAGDCVASIIASGIIPAGIEMMDHKAITACENFCHAGYPTHAGALLIIELDGPKGEVDDLMKRVTAICDDHQAMEFRVSQNEEERLLFWLGRKSAFPACAKLSPDYLVMDGSIPRKALSFVLKRIDEMSAKYGIEVSNVFHAGDGNLHPLIMYDGAKEGDTQKAEKFGADILKLCVEVGGVLSGEHGIGIEKRDLMPVMFSSVDLAHMERLKCAFDPDGLLNPGKMFPVKHHCAELSRLHVHKGHIPHADIPRF